MATYSGQRITFKQALESKLKLVPEVMTWDSIPPVEPDKNGNYMIPIPGKTKFVSKEISEESTTESKTLKD